MIVKIFLAAFLFALISVSAQDKYSSPDQAGMVSTERAFANATSYLGIREGFLTFFSDDAISFDAGLGSAVNKLLKNKISNYPINSKLIWMPEFGDISASGDFGYLFGPWKYEFDPSAKRKTLYGTYFSVWTKNKNGLWKVFFDGGINTQARNFELNNLTFTSLSDSIELKKREMYKPAVSKKEILKQEKNFFLKSGINNIPAVETYFSDKSCLITEGEFPLIGKEEILKFLNKTGKQKYSGDIKGIRIAESGDMAFTYGKYKSGGNESKTGDFYFGRIWEKTPAGKWKIAAQVQKPVE